MAATIDELGIRIVIDASGISGLDQASSAIQSSMQRISSAISSTVSTAAGLAVSMAGIHSAFDAFSAGFSFDSQMQQAEISFETMLGSVDKAQAKITELQDLAIDTPFEFPQLQATTKRMLAFGFAADEIKTDLIAMGDAASGLSLGAAGIDRISLALGQMKAKGKVSGDEMLQLTEVGIPAWDILAKSIGKSTAEVMKLAENGAIPADKAIQALIAGMEERFPNMMAKQSKSFEGMMSTIKDSFTTVMGGIVKPGFDYLSTSVLPAVIESMDQFVKTLRAAGLAAAFKTIIPPVVVDGTVAAAKAIGSAFELIGRHADLITGSVVGLTAAFATYRVITLASTIVTTAHTVALALEIGAVALATRGTAAFTLANIAAAASTAATILATQGLTAAFSALTLALNLNPIVLAVTAAMAVIAGAVYVVYTNWDSFKSWFVSFWNNLVSVVADNIGLIMAAFPGLGAAIYIIYTYWDDGVKLVKDLWNGLCNFVGSIVTVIIRIIDSVATAWPRFTAAAKQGIANFAAALASLAEQFVPDWAKSLYNQIVSLGNALAAKTAAIGNAIRKNLSISVSSGTGIADFRRSEDTNTLPPVTPDIPVPTIDWSGGIGDAGKSKDKGKEETEYERQKRLYEDDVALHNYTQAEKLAKYKEYLAEVSKLDKEKLDYDKGLKELEVNSRKEQLEMERLDLETRIAEGKAGEGELLKQKIAMAAQALAAEREGTLQYKKLLKEKVDAEKAYFDWQYQQLQQQLERQKEHNNSLISLEEEKIRHLKALGLISDEEELRQKAALDEQAYNNQKSEIEKNLQFYQSRKLTELQDYQDLIRQKEVLDDQYRVKAIRNSNAIKEAQLKNTLEIKNNMTNSLSQAFQDIIKGTKSLLASIGSVFQSVGNTILKQFTDRWAKTITDKLFGSILGGKGADTSRIAQETATQSAITSVATAGNAARLVAAKATNLAAAASGAAAATTIVTANAAAFTALLAMISAMAAAVATIPPAGPAMAAAMTAGVAAATGVLTGATAAATASIAGTMSGVASFDVGTWSVPKDMLAMVHKGEPIIPAPFADSARKVLSGEMIPAAAMGGSAGSPTIQLSYSAAHYGRTGQDVQNEMKQNAKFLVKVLQNEWRKFNRQK